MLFALCDAVLPEDADLLIFGSEPLFFEADLSAALLASLLEKWAASFDAAVVLFADLALVFAVVLSLPELLFADAVLAPLTLFAVLAADELLPVVFCAFLLLDADALRFAFCDALLPALVDLLAFALAVLAILFELFWLVLLLSDAVLPAVAPELEAVFADLLAFAVLLLLTLALAEFVLALEELLLRLLVAPVVLFAVVAAELLLSAERFEAELLPELLDAALPVEFLLSDVSLTRLFTSECVAEFDVVAEFTAADFDADAFAEFAAFAFALLLALLLLLAFDDDEFDALLLLVELAFAAFFADAF